MKLESKKQKHVRQMAVPFRAVSSGRAWPARPAARFDHRPQRAGPQRGEILRGLRPAADALAAAPAGGLLAVAGGRLLRGQQGGDRLEPLRGTALLGPQTTPDPQRRKLSVPGGGKRGPAGKTNRRGRCAKSTGRAVPSSNPGGLTRSS